MLLFSFNRRQFLTVATLAVIFLTVLIIRKMASFPSPRLAAIEKVKYLVASPPLVPLESRSRGAADIPLGSFAKADGFDKVETLRRTDLATLSPVELETLYFSIVEQQHIQCPQSERIGNKEDGGWDVCFADTFDIRKSAPCVAFSFGINYIWSYDDLLATKFKCMVYMFDPSMTQETNHKRTTNSWFFLTGLSANNTVNETGWRMRTLCHLFQDLGYAEKPIDILKVDVEFWEWDSFEQALRDGCLVRVKQLLFESHTGAMMMGHSDYAKYIRVWQGLFKLGFRAWKWHENPDSVFYNSEVSGIYRACCYEHYLINTNFIR